MLDFSSFQKSETSTATDKKVAVAYINISFPAKTASGEIVEIPVPLGIPLDFIEVNSKTYVGKYSGEDRAQMQAAVKMLIEQLRGIAGSMAPGESKELGTVTATLQRRGEVQEVSDHISGLSFSFNK